MSFSKQTKILLSNHSQVTFEELLKDHQGARGHSYDSRHNGLEFCNFALPRETGLLRKVVEIELDSDEIIVSSLDQRFLLMDGTAAEARELHMGLPLFGMKSVTGERLYLVRRTSIKDVTDRLITVRTLKYSNFALGCGVFVRPN